MSELNVTVIDLIRRKDEHYVFNSVTIKALINLYQNVECWIATDVSFRSEIEKNIIMNEIKVKNSKFYYWVASSIKLISIIFKVKKNPIVILSLTPFQYLLISIASIFSKKKIYLFMHGELGYLKSSSGLGQRLGAIFMKMAYKFGKVNFICINAPIHAALSKIFPNRKFSFVQHPAVQVELNKKDANVNGPLIFGSFGVHSEEKGSEKIYSLKKYQINDGVKFVTVGVSDGSFSYDKSDSVTHYCKGSLRDSLISKETFFNFVTIIDVALIFNNNSKGDDEKYDLVSSGVFSDCIAFGIPVVALKNKQLISYFEQYGEFGILCETVKDMDEAIQSISSDHHLLEKYRSKMLALKNKFSAIEHQKKIKEILMDG